MKQRKSLGATTAMLLLMSGAAQADVTGAEVWANWKSSAEGMGQVLTPGSEEQSGDTLVITDLRMSAEATDMTLTGTIDRVEFVDQSDGTVLVTLSDSYAMQISMAPEENVKVNMTMQISQPDISILASGGDGTFLYDFSGPEVQVTVNDVTVNGEPLEMGGKIIVSEVAGSYAVTEGGDMDRIVSEVSAANVTVDIDANEPDGGGTFTLDAEFADLVATSDGNLGMMGAMEELPQLLAAGFKTAGDFRHGAATYAVNFQDGDETFQLRATSDAGLLAVSLDSEAVSYEVGNTGLDVTMSGSEIPLPEITAGFAEFGFGFLMPLAKSDAPQDFGMKVTLAGLSVSDMIWSLADPAGALPHDPATLILDIKGKANWLIDVMDPEAAAMMGDEMPAELHALDLSELKVALVGAELTGSGGFTFDNSNLETFDGLPAPTGSIDLTLVGGNALIDKLVAMGLIPEDQAMGARMMLGLFARPGGGEDTLTSKIEVDGATGAISANGQRLQ